MSLEVKKQREKADWFFLTINFRKQCMLDLFRSWNASSKVRLKYLEVLKHQESYGWCFRRLSNIEKDIKHNFTFCKGVRKVKLMYLEVKLKNAQF